MSHGIYTKRDFQVAKEIAWHKLTTVKTPEETDFPNIVAMPLHLENGAEASHGDKKYFMPVSTDDGLPVGAPSCCGENGSYSLFTPHEAWQWVKEVLAGTSFEVQSIGMLWNRSVWFISTHLQELQEATLGDGRLTRFQLNFSGGLDKTVSPQAELSSTVVVCHNTLSLSRMSGETLFASRLTKNFKDRLEASKAEVEKAVGMAKLFKTQMDNLAKKPCSVERARNIIAGYIAPKDAEKLSTRAKNTVLELGELHRVGIGNKGKTEFDLLNAYTQLGTRGGQNTKVDAGRMFASSEFGGQADDKADFARLLTTQKMRLPAIEARGEKLLSVSVDSKENTAKWSKSLKDTVSTN